jgi:hypothetical protein
MHGAPGEGRHLSDPSIVATDQPHHAEIGAGCQKRMLGRALVAAHQDLMRGPARSDDASLRGKFTLSEEGP